MSAHALTQLEFDGYAIGGLAVGEPVEEMYKITEFT
jgi:queuine tRNA-ribosyltransferase